MSFFRSGQRSVHASSCCRNRSGPTPRKSNIAKNRLGSNRVFQRRHRCALEPLESRFLLTATAWDAPTSDAAGDTLQQEAVEQGSAEYQQAVDAIALEDEQLGNENAQQLWQTLATMLETLPDILEKAADIPIIGEYLSTANEYFHQIQGAMDGDVETLGQMQEWIWDTIGSGDNGIGWVMDTNEDGQVTKDDITIEVSNLDGGVPEEVFFEVLIGSSINVAFVGDGSGDSSVLDIGADSLGLEVSGGAEGSIGFSFDLAFGYSQEVGAYVDVASDEELCFEIRADVDLDGEASLGWLSLDVLMDATDDRTQEQKYEAFRDADGQATDFNDVMNAVSAEIHVDFTDDRLGDGDGMLTYSELRTMSNPLDLFEADASVRAGLHMDIVAGIQHSNHFPAIHSDLYVLWQYDVAISSYSGLQAPELPAVQFTNVGMDLGQFATGVVADMAATVNDVLQPVQPFLDFLTSPLPVISDLGASVTMLDLIELSDYGEVADFIAACDSIADMVEAIDAMRDEIAGSEFVLPIGWFTLSSQTLATNGEASNAASLIDSSMTHFAWGNHTGRDVDLDEIESAINELDSQAISDFFTAGAVEPSLEASADFGFKEGQGFIFPILENPAQVYELLLGKESFDLVIYDMPALEVSLDYAQVFPIWGPLSVSLAGELSARADLCFGYDTQGFFDTARSGDAADLLNGLYIVDNKLGPDGRILAEDVPEIEITGAIMASADLNVIAAKASVGGGIYADLSMDLNDPNDDGKLRAGEMWQTMQAGPAYWFDIDGGVDAGLFAKVKIGWGRFGYTKTWDLARAELLNFEHNAPTLPMHMIYDDPALLDDAVNDSDELDYAHIASRQYESSVFDDSLL